MQSSESPGKILVVQAPARPLIASRHLAEHAATDHVHRGQVERLERARSDRVRDVFADRQVRLLRRPHVPSLKGQGFKANNFDVETGAEFWISGCKKRGGDRLYGGIIEIDEDVREEYWVSIRGMPDSKHLKVIKE